MNQQYKEYKEKKEKVIALLEDVKSKAYDENNIKVIDGKIKQLKQDRFIVSIFGHFSNGKSTFLNSLMGFGREVLKEDEAASTATITRLRYADENNENCNKAEVIYRDKRKMWISLDELKDFVARNENVEVEQNIAEVVLYINSPFLENGVEIVDTPGFNSTYQLHTEIALRQVEESDAAIFLFSCGKPGSYEEFEFLKKIKKYMSRVFFVMNKYDLSASGGADEIRDLFRKMEETGIDTEGKVIYPVSARTAKHALANNNQEQLAESKLPVFEKALSEYLVGSENIKDRLYAPLHSIEELMNENKETINMQIDACSKDKDELKKEIVNKKAEIKKKEEELKGKKKSIREGVKGELNSTKAQVRSAVTKVSDTQKNRLSEVKSKFDIRMNSFNELTIETYVQFCNEWETMSSDLEAKLLNVLDTNIDEEEYYDAIEGKISRIIRTNLQLEQINIDEPTFDFSELGELEKDIEKARLEYERVYSKVTSLYAKKEERDQANEEIQQKLKELERLRNKKERRIEALSTVQVEYGTEQKVYDEYVKRSKIGQIFLGSKRVERVKQVQYTDDRAKKAADAEIKKLEAELERSRLVANEEIDKIKVKMQQSGYDSIERQINFSETEEKDKLKNWMEARNRQQSESYRLEQQIVQVEKNKYLAEIDKALHDMGRNIEIFLDKSKDNFISILYSALDAEITAIENEKNNIEKMAGYNDKTPDELEQELSNLCKQLDVVKECINKLNSMKEEIA